jgi:hypothetical protein
LPIYLDPNSWSACEWWYEDEIEIYRFMQENEEEIKRYASEHGMTLRDAIKELYGGGDK